MMTSTPYDYGDCHACGGAMHEKLIKQEFWIKGQLIVIDSVPSGVCEQCGEKIVSAEVGQVVAALAADPERRRTASVITVPVIKYEKTAA
jgi:YgiT-type zinc finger domain-containing protein